MTDTLAVLVPVLNRPQNVKPLVESFVESGTPGELIFILSWGDTAENDETNKYVGGCISHMIPRRAKTWPEKINHGIQVVDADWYLFAADDIRFTEGWWDATRRLRENPTVGVIGTNDSRDGTGNPRVAAGEHTCHPLVSRDYITTHGTIDHPGEAVHAGYHHQFVDDELLWTAKVRGAWAFCREAVIEHLHPFWGQAEWDDTYQLGQNSTDHDMSLWKQRMRLLGLVPIE